MKQTNNNNKGKKPKAEKKMIKREIAKVLNKNERVQRFLMDQNPYAQSLLDPFNVHGVRIPDLTMYPSVPFTIVDRITLTANGQGVAGLAMGLQWVQSSPCYGGLVPFVTTSSGYPQNDLVGTTFSTAATASITNPNGISAGTPYYFPNWATSVRGTFQKVRLVSFGLHITNTGTITTAQGKFTGCSAPRDYFRQMNQSGTPVNISIDDLAKVPGAKVVPVSHKEGLSVFYHPLDFLSLTYADMQDKIDIGTGSILNTNTEYKGCELVLAVDGATIDQSFLVTLVANYEGVPKTNAFLLNSAERVTPDSIAIDHAFNVAESAPTAVAVDPIESPSETLEKGLANKQPVVHHEVNTNQQDSLVSTMMGGIDKVMNSDLVKGVKEFAPLIEGALSLL